MTTPPPARRRARRRRGMAALEVVLITALALPMAATLYLLARYALRGFFDLIAHAVGCPIL